MSQSVLITIVKMPNRSLTVLCLWTFGDSGDSDSVICDSYFAQAEARKKSKATSASATCAWKRPHPGAAMYRKPEWKKEFP